MLRSVIFTAIAVVLSLATSLIGISFMVAMPIIGMPLIFILLFIFVPFAAGWIAGYRHPVQFMVLVGLIIIVGMILYSVTSVSIISDNIFGFIALLMTYFIPALIVDFIKP